MATNKEGWVEIGSLVTPGTGDVTGPAASVDDEVVLYSGVTGKVIKRASSSGRPKLTSGVLSVSNIDLASEITGKLPFANLADATGPIVFARTTASAGAMSAHTLSAILDFISGAVAQGDILYRGAATWKRLAAGTAGLFLQTAGAGADLLWASAVSGSGVGIYTGTGNPQGQTSLDAAKQQVGSIYMNTSNGYLYRKLGGGTTAYGWYLECPFPSALWTTIRPFQMWAPHSSTTQNASTAIDSLYFAGDPFNGSGLNNQTREYAASQIWNYFDTSTTANANSFVATTASQLRWWETDFDICLRMRTPAAITLIRLWFGLTTASITDDNEVAAGAKSCAMFRYSTPSTDPGWVGLTANAAASGAGSVTANVANIAADTVYNLRIRLVRAGTPTVFFSVNDGTEIGATLNLVPTGVTSFLTFGVTNKTAGGAGNIRGFRWAGVTGWYGTPA